LQNNSYENVVQLEKEAHFLHVETALKEKGKMATRACCNNVINTKYFVCELQLKNRNGLSIISMRLARIQQEKKTLERHSFISFRAACQTNRQATTTTIQAVSKWLSGGKARKRTVIIHITYIYCFSFKANSKVFCNVLF